MLRVFRVINLQTQIDTVQVLCFDLFNMISLVSIVHCILLLWVMDLCSTVWSSIIHHYRTIYATLKKVKIFFLKIWCSTYNNTYKRIQSRQYKNLEQNKNSIMFEAFEPILSLITQTLVNADKSFTLQIWKPTLKWAWQNFSIIGSIVLHRFLAFPKINFNPLNRFC